MGQEWEMGVLPNGVRVVTCPMPKSKRVMLEAWFDVGSRNESQGEEGAAHAVEHMVFKAFEGGGRILSPLEVTVAIDDIGGRFNAHTGTESTCYDALVLQKHVPQAFALIGGMVCRPSFPGDEVPKEIDVILQEIAGDKTDHDSQATEHMFATAYPGMPLGRPVLGYEQTVAGFTRDQLAMWHESQYVAGKLLVLAAGGITHAQTMDLAYQHFSGMRQGAGVAPVASTFASGVGLRRARIEQAHVCLAFDGTPSGHAREPVLDLAAMIMGEGYSARLPLEIRERRGWAYHTESSHSCSPDGGLFYLYAQVDPRRAGESLRIMVDQIAGLADTVTEQELERVKTIQMLNILDIYDGEGAATDIIAEGLLTRGRVDTYEETVRAYESVTLEQLRGAVMQLVQQPYMICGYGDIRTLEKEVERMGGVGQRLGV